MEYSQDEPDLTPMLDVVFIMLIFIIVTATFVNEVGISLPTSNDPKQQQASEKSAVVDINELNRFTLNGKAVDSRALQNQLAAFHAEYPDSPLVVRPNPQADTESLVHAMDAGRAVGMSVAFADVARN